MALSISDLIILGLILICGLIGLIQGFVARILRLVNIAIATLLASYFSTMISSLFVDTSFYNKTYEVLKGFTPYVFLVISFILIYIIVRIILFVISRLIKGAINAGKVGKVIDKILGVLSGAIIGATIGIIYLYVLTILGNYIPVVESFRVKDLALDSSKFTLSKYIVMYLDKLLATI